MDRITNSDSHFLPLVNNSRVPLENLGFELTSEDNQKFIFEDKNGVVVQIVYQKYDPPEVWIKRKTDIGSIRLDNSTECFFNSNTPIWKRNLDLNGNFNYSSFDFFADFLTTYLTELVEKGDFVGEINDWFERSYGTN